mmetsp:Transcript_146713/g.254759  ORF Transcript_146713/g.254759 Transcript_146713/m.254759 type:complete len:162 (-) Transcript_146713:35-520(-)
MWGACRGCHCKEGAEQTGMFTEEVHYGDHSEFASAEDHLKSHLSETNRLAPEAKLQRGGPDGVHEFIATIKKTSDMAGQIGAEIELGERELTVKQIVGGPVEVWNMNHPDQEIKKGDKIVQVNDTQGLASTLIFELKMSETLLLKVHRYPGDLCGIPCVGV